LGIFWDSLHNYAKIKNIEANNIFTQEHFNSVLDLFPEFIRPNILSILQYVKLKKISKQCHSAIIYTNNQGPKEWAYFIKNYFESKLKYRLFNHVISAFKANGKRIEMCRTTHDKNMKDFIRCSKLPENSEICYLDDTYYPDMNNSNVYYIKIKPYVHDVHFDTMIRRYAHSGVSKKLISDKQTEQDFFDFMKNNMNSYEYICTEKNKDEYEIDKITTKKTMAHVRAFFNGSNSDLHSTGNKKTLKYKNKNASKTRKNY
jgi:hypothetical protein